MILRMFVFFSLFGCNPKMASKVDALKVDASKNNLSDQSAQVTETRHAEENTKEKVEDEKKTSDMESREKEEKGERENREDQKPKKNRNNKDGDSDKEGREDKDEDSDTEDKDEDSDKDDKVDKDNKEASLLKETEEKSKNSNDTFDRSCQSDQDCGFLNRKTKKISFCAPLGGRRNKWIAVSISKENHEENPGTECPTQHTRASCVHNVCTKSIPTQPQPGKLPEE